MDERDLVVIGGGAGGLVVTSVAAQLGLRVTLIEREPKLGGDCLHYGCVPSKTLIKAAKVADLMRRGPEFGLPACEPQVDLAQVMAHVQGVVDHIQHHDDPQRFRDYGAEVVFGEARFVDPHTVEVNGERVRGRRFVIATGSRPAIPPVPGLAEAGYLTNEDVFSLEDLPRRLAVIGGGPIGIELAQALARLGSRVSVLERGAEILGKDDPELAGRLREILIGQGLDVRVGVKIEQVEDDGQRLRLGDDSELEVDRILVAAGRQPNVDGLNLEAAGVAVGRGGIQVDRRMRSSQKHIYAVGDCCGPFPFTHMAEYQAGIVISNAVFRFPKKADYSVVPWVTYTDPELAQVGLTEAQVRERGVEPQVLRFEFKDVDRALAEVEPHGLVKFVVHRQKVLGATILGPHAGELVHEIVLAMQAGVKIGKISAAIHAYPTLAQVHRRAVNSAYAPRLFSPGTRRLVGWINKLLP